VKVFDTRPRCSQRFEIFLIEKEIDLPVNANVTHKTHSSSNYQQGTTLILDDGTTITETLPICRFLESMFPRPNLFGLDASESARVEMWNNHLECELYLRLKARNPTTKIPAKELSSFPPSVGGSNGEDVEENFLRLFEYMNAELQNRRFIVCDRPTFADVTALASLAMLQACDMNVPQHLNNVKRWCVELEALPSAIKSNIRLRSSAAPSSPSRAR
jgi:glutathione S-transferase